MKTIQFYNTVPGVSDMFPIVEAKNYKPDWIKKTKEDLVKNKTVGKNLMFCPGIFDLYKTGYIVTMWYDVVIKTEKDKPGFSWQVANSSLGHLTNIKFIDTHADNISKHIPRRKGTIESIVKINTTWNIIVPDNLKFLCIPICYPDHHNYESYTGILDPSMSSEINIQLMWNVDDGEILIKAGTPLMHLIPLSDETYDLQCRDATEKDLIWTRKLEYFKTFSFTPVRNIIQKLYKSYFKK
jgi:hypothetical protein